MTAGPADPGDADCRVRLARLGEEHAIGDVCRAGFAASSAGLLPPEVVARQADRYYDPARVREEIRTAGATPRWQGYVVAVSPAGDVLGAAGGGVVDGVGQLLVLYLDLAHRGRGIGTALLGFVTDQQRAAGAGAQWVSVTEGNEMGLPFYRARGFAVRDRVPFAGDEPAGAAYSLRMCRPI